MRIFYFQVNLQLVNPFYLIVCVLFLTWDVATPLQRYIHPFYYDHRLITPSLVPSCVEIWVKYWFNDNYKPHKLTIGGPCMNYFDLKLILIITENINTYSCEQIIVES
jgi:hypothetical protein